MVPIATIVRTSLVLICILCPSLNQAEMFTSITDLEFLVETHATVIASLNDYIQKEDNRLHVLKEYLNLYKREQEKAMEDVSSYLGNPINAYTLIKRLTTDLDYIEETINNITGYTASRNSKLNGEKPKSLFPTSKDLQGAADGLQLLQTTYRLNVTDLAQGILNGVAYSTPMSASDCYVLGKAMLASGNYASAVLWMVEALRKVYQGHGARGVCNGDIMEYIAKAHSQLGDKESTLELILALLDMYPDPVNTRAQINVDYYRKLVDANYMDNATSKKEVTDTGPSEDSEAFKFVSDRFSFSQDDYDALCRGELELPADVTAKLHCRYLNDKPFLKLAPIKMEQRYIDPDVFVFHDVISDDEIQHLKEIAKPQLVPAKIAGKEPDRQVDSKEILSKVAQFDDDASPVVARVSRRVADFTGLSLVSAEDLKITNYGISGYFGLHYDIPVESYSMLSKSGFTGHRLATIMFYMSDVAQGGATVFPEMGLSVFPEKGAALYWRNLLPSGEGDLSSLHAGCPVLQGSKWVCNKWIRERGQEFVKPCNLEHQRMENIRKHPSPVRKSIV